jgi:hypothetical protein
MIRGIIVRILRDAWMVAPGLVSKRGDRVRGHRIRERFSSRALSRWRFLLRARHGEICRLPHLNGQVGIQNSDKGTIAGRDHYICGDGILRRAGQMPSEAMRRNARVALLLVAAASH